MLNAKVLCLVAVFVAGCSGKTEMGGEAVPGKQPSSPTAASSAKHLVVVIQVEPGAHKLTTLDARSVDQPLPTRRLPVSGAWRVEVLAADGALLYAVEMPDASVVRAEAPGPDGQLQGTHVRRDNTAVTVRLPFLSGAATVRLVETDVRPGASGATEIGRVAYPSVTP